MSWKWCVITGKRLAAWTIPYPIRWVKETFLPLAASWALSALRRASRMVAGMSRNEVAVGTVSDSVMFATRRAAGPVRGVAPGGVVGAGSLEPGAWAGGAGVAGCTSAAVVATPGSWLP